MRVDTWPRPVPKVMLVGVPLPVAPMVRTSPFRELLPAAPAVPVDATMPVEPLVAVAEEHGWLLGRIADPYGHHWEIGRPLGAWPPPAPTG